MSLSAEDRAMRLTGIGASEIAAVLEIGPDPKFGPLRLWCKKPTPTRPPLLVEEDEDEPLQSDEDGTDRLPPAAIGHALEQAMRELYASRTGIQMAPAATMRHRRVAHVLATPDGLSDPGHDRGLEIKIVGARMAHHWADDAVPEYVESQCAQGMAVTGRSQWGVIALVGGTDLRIHRLTRDPELEELLLDEASRFWVDHVDGDRPPPEMSWQERRQYLRLRYGRPETTTCRIVEDGVLELADRLARINGEIKLLETEKETVTNALINVVGDDYGIAGAWGKFLHYPVAGRIDWRAVAEELAGGAVPEPLAEKHRGKGHRVPRLYQPSKTRKARKR